MDRRKIRYICIVIVPDCSFEFLIVRSQDMSFAKLVHGCCRAPPYSAKVRTEQQHIKAAAAITHYITMFYTAAITKQSKNQPIGIGLEDTDYGIAISSINPEGPLSQTSLKPGLKLLIINNIEVSGLSPKEVGKILNNVGDKLVLSAVDIVPDITFQVNTSRKSKRDNRQTNERVVATMKRDTNDATPTIFNEAGVPSNTFSRIYKLIESELLPAAMALRSHETTYNREMQSYTSKQMIKGGLVGFGTESNHEKKVFQMVAQGAQLQRNVDLKAMQVKDKTNAMLAKYNIMATVALESRRLGKYSSKQMQANEALDVVGLEFHRIE
eukprot:scaffold7649_cov154-Skeletonema_marinoi.AAC.14